MNGNTRSIVVRLTPKQAVHVYEFTHRSESNAAFRAAQYIREQLEAAGWRRRAPSRGRAYWENER